MSKKQISVDSTVFAILSLTIGAFVAGIMLSGVFLRTPAPDLGAEYCRGIADEALRSYTAIRGFFVGLEEQTLAMGAETVVAAVIDGQVVDQAPISTQLLPALPPDYLNIVTEACLSHTPEQFLEEGLRGPSNMAPLTPTTMVP